MTKSNPEFIHTQNAPQLDAHLSHAVRYGDFIFASGQIPIDPASGAVCRRRHLQSDATGNGESDRSS